MQANTMYFKLVPQRCGSFNVLCGFNTKLVFATAERITSAASNVTAQEVERIAQGHAKDLNAAIVQDVTVDSVYKKIAKQTEKLLDVKSFAGMGIAQYL